MYLTLGKSTLPTEYLIGYLEILHYRRKYPLGTWEIYFTDVNCHWTLENLFYRQNIQWALRKIHFTDEIFIVRLKKSTLPTEISHGHFQILF